MKKIVNILLVLAFLLMLETNCFAFGGGFGGGTDPSVVTDTAETMAKSVLRVMLLSIPILYFIGVVLAAVIFAFKSYNRAKNDQVENPGKVAAMTALVISLVGFGGGGILFLAADKWLFGGQFFTTFQALISGLVR